LFVGRFFPDVRRSDTPTPYWFSTPAGFFMSAALLTLPWTVQFLGTTFFGGRRRRRRRRMDADGAAGEEQHFDPSDPFETLDTFVQKAISVAKSIYERPN
jgi:hypothetical protein